MGEPAEVTKSKVAPIRQNAESRIPKIEDRRTDELVLAVVGPVGSGGTRVADLLGELLAADFGYTLSRYKLSSIVEESAELLGENRPRIGTGAARVAGLQQTGNQLRKKFGEEYLAAKCIERIARWRDQKASATSEIGEPIPERKRHVHILDSLKNPAEMRLLRDTYGDLFWLFGVFAPIDVRRARLRNLKGFQAAELDEVIAHDYKEAEPFGQSVRDTFFQSDFFVRNDQANDVRLKRDLLRYLDILFGVAVHTPTKDESSMYAAYSQSMGSACLSRQVGAAIVSTSGDVIGLGGNDVPKYGGSLYRFEDGDNDHRCFKWGTKLCHNDQQKGVLYRQIYSLLEKDGLLVAEASPEKVIAAVAATEVRDLIEYSRAVHAEMEAIISVARGQKAGLVGATMYCTTYPCHSCARHIVASGIHTVIYVEPYPKSRAFALHNDAVSESESDIGKKLVFLQYNGVAPKHALRLFRSDRDRKDSAGRLVASDRKFVTPISETSLDDYSTHERYVIAHLSEKENRAKEAQPKLI
jgi:deoxycytidylate deaminase